MPSKITNSGLVTTYNNRGLICHNANTRPVIQLSDGTLFAAIREQKVTEPISIFRSTDHGFSWERVYKGDFASSQRKVAWTGLNTNGPIMHLTAFEEANKLILWHSFGDVGTGKYDVEPFVFDLDTLERRTSSGFPTQMDLDIDELVFDVAHNQNTAFLVYVSYAQLRVHMVYPTGIAAFDAEEKSGDFFNLVNATCTEDSRLHILVAANGNPYKLQHFRFGPGGFTGPHHVANMPGQSDVLDILITRDGRGTLLATWGEHSADGSDVKARYALSMDDGSTWTEAADIPREPGHSVFIDVPTGFRAARTTAIAGHSGFILSYVTEDANGKATTFVRELATNDDGETYELGSSRQIGAQAAADEHITGLRFFKPPQPKLTDITLPGHVRIAYQIGQGNSTTQTDARPVRIGQELLSESAFPVLLPSQMDVYEEDTALDGEMLVSVNILGGPSERHDYYGLGMVGTITRRYISAFNKVGIECRLLRYDPLPHSTLSDKSAYGPAQEGTAKITVDSRTYQYPLAGRGGESHFEYIERDIRSVHLPPQAFLERDFIVNRGGYLKRTVWVLEFDGNSYELTQTVPYFVDGVIAYYTVNAYVIGPSHDPFSRPVLSSET